MRLESSSRHLWRSRLPAVSNRSCEGRRQERRERTHVDRAVITKNGTPRSKNSYKRSNTSVRPTSSIGKFKEHLGVCPWRCDPESNNDTSPARQMDEQHDSLNERKFLRKMDVENSGDDQRSQTEERWKPLAVRPRGIRVVYDGTVLYVVADNDRTSGKESNPCQSTQPACAVTEKMSHIFGCTFGLCNRETSMDSRYGYQYLRPIDIDLRLLGIYSRRVRAKRQRNARKGLTKSSAQPD